MDKKNNKKILVCENCASRNYVIYKSSIGQNKRIEVKKFCKNCNSHVIHKETR